MKKTGKRGISTVMGTIFFIILTIVPASILFMTVINYNNATKDSMKLEEERKQESILLYKLETEFIEDYEYIANITLNNTGSITSRIRAVYINENFMFDPSDNQNTYVDPKKSLTISFPLFPNQILYDPNSRIVIATERGIKSSEYAYLLKGEYVTTGYEFRPYYGPLQLNFDDFKYTENDPQTGYYDNSSWKNGWRIEVRPQTIVWRINVTDIDTRDITITQFSCFTLSTNDQPSARLVWYIDFPSGQLNKTIRSNEWLHLVYEWSTPLDFNPRTQKIFSTTARAKVFLTFFGYFHEKDGRIKPYGQTIPFEAVLFTSTQGTITITAVPDIVPADGVSTSTITAYLTDRFGNPINGVPVRFNTSLGTLSSPTATTVNGYASVTLRSSVAGLAIVNATYGTLMDWTTVNFISDLRASAQPSTIPADGMTTSTITAEIYDSSGNPIDGETITFVSAFGDLNASSAITVNGKASVTISSSTPGLDDVTVTWRTLSRMTTVNFVTGLTVSASPIVIPADSVTSSTITVLLYDQNGNPVNGATIVFTSNISTTSPTSATTVNGRASVTLDPTGVAGTANITARWLGLSSSTFVKLVPTSSFTISASPTIIPADSSSISTITAELYDLNGNPVDGETIAFSSDLGTLSSLTATTVNGKASVTLTSPTIGLANVTATWFSLEQTTTIDVKDVISVTTDRSDYSQNDTVSIKGYRRIVDAIQRVITIEISYPANVTTILSINVTTDIGGLFTYDYVLINANPGIYGIRVVDEDGFEAYTFFNVI